MPLYWLLISKGHRTYRYLPAFSRAFHPSPDDAGTGELRALKDFLARDRFGADYDAATGVVRFPESRGHLRAPYAEVPDAHLRLPRSRLFPGSAIRAMREATSSCACANSRPTRLQPIARRAFVAGARER